MKDWVINLTVVLADGTVIKTRRRPRYGLIKLFFVYGSLLILV
jgi:FAD/FMN-containing dehydrogenase